MIKMILKVITFNNSTLHKIAKLGRGRSEPLGCWTNSAATRNCVWAFRLYSSPASSWCKTRHAGQKKEYCHSLRRYLRALSVDKVITAKWRWHQCSKLVRIYANNGSEDDLAKLELPNLNSRGSCEWTRTSRTTATERRRKRGREKLQKCKQFSIY